MKRLVVMRHAKSSWKHLGLRDHERPLNGRGRRDSPRIATELERLDWAPTHVISSDSQRTVETWKRMLPVFQQEIVVYFDQGLYHGGFSELHDGLLDVTSAHPEAHTILALGHNPGWEESLYQLTGDLIEMKTASTALLSSKLETWTEALRTRRSWSVEGVLHPRLLHS